jgi:hypothetical protein
MTPEEVSRGFLLEMLLQITAVWLTSLVHDTQRLEHIRGEIIATEKTYVAGLDLLVNVCIPLSFPEQYYLCCYDELRSFYICCL